MYPRSELFVCLARFFSCSVTAANKAERFRANLTEAKVVDWGCCLQGWERRQIARRFRAAPLTYNTPIKTMRLAASTLLFFAQQGPRKSKLSGNSIFAGILCIFIRPMIITTTQPGHSVVVHGYFPCCEHPRAPCCLRRFRSRSRPIQSRC